MTDSLSCLREGALFVIRSDFASALVSGPDRASWLNALLTCDVSSLQANEARAGLALNKQGKVLSEALVLPTGDSLHLALHAATQTALLEHLDQHLIMEDATVTAAPESTTWLIGYGPKAKAVAEDLQQISSLLHWGALSHFGYSAVVASLPTTQQAQLLARLSDPPRVEQISLAQFDALRLDLGILRYGVEFTDSTYPQEAALDEHAINFNKGCYLGQEVVVKMRSRGSPVRKTVRLLATHSSPASPGDPVLSASGETVGTVLSSCSSQLIPEQVIAIASVRTAESSLGTELRLGDAPARIVALVGLLA